MKVLTAHKMGMMALTAVLSASFALGAIAQAATSSEAPTSEELAASKKQEDRMSAVNRALEQALAERAKSQSEYERHSSKTAALADVSAKDVKAGVHFDLESREVRSGSRDSREETRREKRLNWLND